MDYKEMIKGKIRDIEALPDEIKQHIRAAFEEEHEMNDNRLYVTELLYCLRKAYFRRMEQKLGIKQEQELQNLWYAYRGRIFDEVFTPLFERNQIRITHRIPGGPTIVGRIDFIKDGEIWEMKTALNSAVEKYGAKEQHVKQALFYAWVENADKVKLLYITMKGITIYELDTSKAEEVVKELEENALILWWSLKQRKPPRAVKTWECRFCPYYKFCFSSDGSLLSEIGDPYLKNEEV